MFDRQRISAVADGPSSRRLAVIAPCALILLLVAPGSLRKPGHAALSAQEAAPVDFKKLEGELKKAVLAKNPAQVSQLVAQLAPIDDPKCAELLIRYALMADSYEVERQAGQVLAAMQSAAARAVIYSQLAKNPNFQVRIVLAAVAYQLRADPKAMAALGEAVRDARPEVVYSALKWLRAAKDIDIAANSAAVGILIERLAKEEHRPGGRLCLDILATLRELSGVDIVASVDWKNYWEARQAGAAAPPPRTSGGVTGVARRKTFFTVSIESERLVFLIDVSQSMNKKDPLPEKPEKAEEAPKGTTVVGEKKKKEKPKPPDPDTLPDSRKRISRVKAELVRSIEALPESTFFTIESFSSEVKFLDEKNPALIQATPANKTRAVQWVKNLAENGETWTDTAFEELFKRVQAFDTIILLSDGAPKRNNVALPADGILEGIRVLNRFVKARIHAIGFLQEGKNLKYFLKKIAEQHDGTYVELE